LKTLPEATIAQTKANTAQQFTEKEVQELNLKRGAAGFIREVVTSYSNQGMEITPQGQAWPSAAFHLQYDPGSNSMSAGTQGMVAQSLGLSGPSALSKSFVQKAALTRKIEAAVYVDRCEDYAGDRAQDRTMMLEEILLESSLALAGSALGAANKGIGAKVAGFVAPLQGGAVQPGLFRKCMAGAASDESYYKTMKMQNEVNNDKERGNKNKDGKRQRREHNNNRWSRQHDRSRSPSRDQRGRSLSPVSDHGKSQPPKPKSGGERSRAGQGFGGKRGGGNGGHWAARKRP